MSWDWIAKLQELKGQKAALVTLISCDGSTPRETGAKMIVLPDGTFYGTIGGGLLEQKLIGEAVVCIARGESQHLNIELCPRTGQCCGGRVEVFVDVLKEPPKLYLFGAGHVGQALSRTLEGTPFEVHVVDPRKDWIEAEALSKSAIRHRKSWDEFVAGAEWNEKSTYVAVMTHSHDMDQDIIGNVTKRPAKYVGLIGSESKWRRFQHRLAEAGTTRDELGRVRCPIGLPIGGKAPQEVAISVASELLQVLHEGAT